MSENSINENTTSPNNLNHLHKLLPFILIAEIGFVVIQIGFFISIFSTGAFILLIGILASIAAIVFTILYAVNIKPRFAMAAAMVCISLAIFFYLVLVAVSDFVSIPSYRSYLATVKNEDEKATILQIINRKILLGSVWGVFAVSVLPLLVYLPIWYLRRKTANA